jgi:uncharacterized protein YdeI (YjbR/CyaY-like superfamily)
MPNTSKLIDAYIEKTQPFAKPILIHLRDIVHSACPDVEEKMKWSFPHFDYKGEMLCSMASFKQHAVFGFWKASLMKDKSLMENAATETSMGHLGKLTTLKDLPSDKKLSEWIKEAMKLNDDGIKIKKAKTGKKEFSVPDILFKAINKNKRAKAVWDKASYSFQKEYSLWVSGAKSEEIQIKRTETAVEWVAEGKGRNWKYEVKK